MRIIKQWLMAMLSPTASRTIKNESEDFLPNNAEKTLDSQVIRHFKIVCRSVTIIIASIISMSILASTNICAPATDRIRNLAVNPILPFTDFNSPLGDSGCVVDNCVEYILTACDGTKIRVQEWKNSHGQLNTNAKSVVMIHGFPHSHLIYTKQVNSFLADKYRIITYDVRGQGSSDKPIDIMNKYQNQNYADDLNDVIQGLNLHKPIIIAHSYGGTIPVDYVTFYEVKKISGIVFIGAFTRLDFTGSAGGSPSINDQVFVNNGPNLIPGILSANLGFFIQESKHFVALSTNRPIDQATDILAIDTMTPVIARSGAFLVRLVPMGNPQGNDVFNKILAKIPTFVIHSKYDHLIKFEHALDNYNLMNAYGNSKLWLINDSSVGHTPQLEIPDEVNFKLDQFISDH